MKRRAVLGGLGLAAVAGAGAWATLRRQPGETLIDLGAAQAQDAAAPVDTSKVAEMIMGSADAPVTVIEYASYTCPHCANFHSNVFPLLRKDYIDTGKVKFIFREVYFDRFGLWGAMLARCGGQMRYFGISDILFDTQADWLAGGDPTKIGDNLRKIGLTAGLSKEQIDSCMNDAENAKALVAKYQENATADDITATPTFFINGTKYSNMDYAEFSKLLDAELAKG
jgi:protein-disulfide isomerase